MFEGCEILIAFPLLASQMWEVPSIEKVISDSASAENIIDDILLMKQFVYDARRL